MLTQRQISVGADDFTLTQFPTTKALSYGIAIGKIAGAMLADGLDKMAEDVEGDFIGALDTGGMVRGLLSQLHQDKAPELSKNMLRDALVSYTVGGGTRTKWEDSWYENRFAGALDDLVELLSAVFEDNFVAVIDVVKKKAGVARTTPVRSSASDNGAVGAVPTPEASEESTTSFFG